MIDISTHTSHTGGDSALILIPTNYQRFQPTPPTREVTENTLILLSVFLFQPTPPTREVTSSAAGWRRIINISTHTSHTGGDVEEIKLFHSSLLFQPTPPTREVTALDQTVMVHRRISTHTSHTGGDSNYYQKFSSHFIHHQQFSSHLLLPLSKFLKINNYPHRILPHFQTSSSANPPEFSCSLPIRTYHKISVSSTAIPRSTPTCSTFVL